MPLCACASVRVGICATAQVCMYAYVYVCLGARMWVHRYAPGQMRRCAERYTGSQLPATHEPFRLSIAHISSIAGAARTC